MLLKRQECDQCLLKQKCVYALVFETAEFMDLPKNSRIASPPRPFVIEPPLTTETDFSKGSTFDFNMLLFGEVNNNLPYFIYAIDQMGEIGIGKKVGGERGRFSLKTVKYDGQIIYSDTDQKLNTTGSIDTLSIPETEEYGNDNSGLKKSLITV